MLQVLSGACVLQGELDAAVTAVGRNTFFGRTIALLGAPEERGHLQKVYPACAYLMLSGCVTLAT